MCNGPDDDSLAGAVLIFCRLGSLSIVIQIIDRDVVSEVPALEQNHEACNQAGEPQYQADRWPIPIVHED